MTDDMHLQNILYDQFGTLLNVILDGRKSHLESIKYSQKAGILLRQYQTDRNKLIKPLSKYLINYKIIFFTIHFFLNLSS